MLALLAVHIRTTGCTCQHYWLYMSALLAVHVSTTGRTCQHYCLYMSALLAVHVSTTGCNVPGPVRGHGDGVPQDAVPVEAADPRKPQGAGQDLRQSRQAPRRSDRQVGSSSGPEGGESSLTMHQV